MRAQVRVIGGGLFRDTVTGTTQPAAFGGAGLIPDPNWTLTTGTGANAVNLWYHARRTLAATTYDDLDLAGGLTGPTGAALTFTAVKYVRLDVVSADGSKKLRVGPQGRSNAGQLWWGGTGATVYQDVYYTFEQRLPTAGGWAVTAGTGDIFPVYNPTGSSITYSLWVMGLA